jgi:type I restriction enzyme S subunit
MSFDSTGVECLKTSLFSELIAQGTLQIGDGYRAKNDELGGAGTIFLRAGHVRDTHIDFDGADRFQTEDNSRFKEKVSRPGDVVVTTKGNSTGRVALVTRDMPEFVYSPHLSYWRSLDESHLCQGFLRAWSRGAEFKNQLDAMCRSTDMAPYLSLSDQKRLRITLLPVAEQREVARVLDALDDRLTLLRETNTTLEAIAQALFKSWFVDFDPVRAKQEGRSPEGMDEATAALFPDGFEESELGELPKGWQIARIENIAEKVGMGPFGSNIKVSTFVDDGVPVLSGKNLQSTLLEDHGSNYVTEAHAEKLKNSVVRPGDVVLTHRGTLGQVSLIPEGAKFQKYMLSQSQFFLRCDKDKMTPEWITYFLRSPAGQHSLLANSAQVGVPSIARPVSYLRSMKFLLPSREVLGRFSSITAGLHEGMTHNKKRIEILTSTRDMLLPRLISGQLRSPEAEALVA